jgi:hypothetical protein
MTSRIGGTPSSHEFPARIIKHPTLAWMFLKDSFWLGIAFQSLTVNLRTVVAVLSGNQLRFGGRMAAAVAISTGNAGSTPGDGFPASFRAGFMDPKGPKGERP